MLKRLEEKGLTQKQEDPDNRSKLLISLTALGNTAYWAHKHWHETMDSGFICRYRFFFGNQKIAIRMNGCGTVGCGSYNGSKAVLFFR